jgi:hypothetical protein
MKGEPREMMLRTAVLEWQKKYGVQDGDPLLASLELFQIYLANLQTGDDAGTGIRFRSFVNPSSCSINAAKFSRSTRPT